MLIDTTQLALERSISGASQRHEALAANIANASTPGYQRVDVDFHGALAAALGSSDAKSALGGHELRDAGRRRASAPRRPTATRSTSRTSRPSSSANALEQQAAVSVAKTRNAILRAAMGVS